MAGERRAAHEAFVRGYAERCLLTPAERGAARGGLGDAAHLADAMAADILASRRKSKGRDAIVAVLKECGDAIWGMRKLVAEPSDPAARTLLQERRDG